MIAEALLGMGETALEMTARKRVLLVFGTRPEAIKMAPVYQALCAEPHAFEPICCVTAQHRRLLDHALATFGIVPDIDLGLMRAGQQPEETAAAVLAGVSEALRQVSPDLVLVHGDTTTTMAAALATFYAGIALGHVEAGLRSDDLRAPFPEEFNRRLTSLAARYHFVPTQAGQDNLLREGCDPASIHVTGNTVVDALLQVAARLDRDGALASAIARELVETLGFDWQRERFVLVTCHRREAFGQGLEAICAAVAHLAETFTDVRFVLPVHPNPVVQQAVASRLGGRPRIHLTAALRYEACVGLLQACHFVLTDSGGLQEEAPSLGKPVLVMREVTERPEAIAAGCAALVGIDAGTIVAAAGRLLNDPLVYSDMVATANPYGDGRAALRIAEVLRTC